MSQHKFILVTHAISLIYVHFRWRKNETENQIKSTLKLHDHIEKKITRIKIKVIPTSIDILLI